MGLENVRIARDVNFRANDILALLPSPQFFDSAGQYTFDYLHSIGEEQRQDDLDIMSSESERKNRVFTESTENVLPGVWMQSYLNAH